MAPSAPPKLIFIVISKKAQDTMIRKPVAVLLLLLGTIGRDAHAGARESCRPYSQGFPQIIQELDYPTIEAIEGLLAELKKLPNGDISCATAKESISLKRRSGRGGEVLVSVPQNGPVSISGRPYKSKNTLVLFSTLKKLLADLSAKTPCAGVKYDQFATRAYRKRTIIEFDFGSQIVVIDAFSNGPMDGERLYVLDLKARKDSFFWSRY